MSGRTFHVAESLKGDPSSGIKGGLLALKEFQNPCLNYIAVVATDSTMVAVCIKGG